MAAVGNMHPSLHFNNRYQSRGFCDGRIVGELLVMLYQFKMSHDGSTNVVEHSAGLAGGRVLMRGPGHLAREGLRFTSMAASPNQNFQLLGPDQSLAHFLSQPWLRLAAVGSHWLLLAAGGSY